MVSRVTGALVLLIAVGSAQVDTAWVRKYLAPGGRSDAGFALAVTDDGDVFVAGQSWAAGDSFDGLLVKYNSSGVQQWAARYNGPGDSLDRFRAVAVDAAGFIYVTGESWGGEGPEYDYVTIKYQPSGETAWVRRYNGPADRDDKAYALALDDSGNVYVTGYSIGVGTASDFATIKYSPDGDSLWVARYNHSNFIDWAVALVVDRQRNVFVTGKSATGFFAYDWATIEYEPSGVPIWTARYNGPMNGWDEPAALAIDDFGSTWVAGYVQIGDGNYDFATIRYYPGSDTQWVRTYDGPAQREDGASSLGVDRAGSCYVTGVSRGADSTMDFATLKYSLAGRQEWVARYGNPGQYDMGVALAADDSGVYVTGSSDRSGPFTSDITTLRYSSTGALRWQSRYPGSGTESDGPSAIARDRDGYLYVAGAGGDPGGLGWAITVKYQPWSGVEERSTPYAIRFTPEDGPTVVRGVLYLWERPPAREDRGQKPSPTVLLDASGGAASGPERCQPTRARGVFCLGAVAGGW